MECDAPKERSLGFDCIEFRIDLVSCSAHGEPTSLVAIVNGRGVTDRHAGYAHEYAESTGGKRDRMVDFFKRKCLIGAGRTDKISREAWRCGTVW